MTKIVPLLDLILIFAFDFWGAVCLFGSTILGRGSSNRLVVLGGGSAATGLRGSYEDGRTLLLFG